MIKRTVIVFAIILFAFAISAQEIQHDAIAINIEVPVRVFKGKTFIDNLTIDDFEIYEDGILQKTEAVYLIRKMDILREDTEMEKEEARKIFAPEVSRNFVLLFEIHEYYPTVGNAIEYFFNDVFSEGDSLVVLTPARSYRFNKKSFEKFTKEEISDELVGQLRKDVKMSASEYRSLIHDLESLETLSGLDADMVEMMRKNIVRKLSNLRYLDEKKLLNFADALKSTEGPKHVFFFLQKLLVPIITNNPVFTVGDLHEFEAYVSYDEKNIKQLFSDSSITAHMIYLTKVSDFDYLNKNQGSLTARGLLDTSNPVGPRVTQDISASAYSAFSDIAQATGGIVDSSTNAAASFKKTSEASENYYLLYYSPKNYIADGKFKEITVKVKGQKYKIMHRAGYIAD
jgi:hypothetical protein